MLNMKLQFYETSAGNIAMGYELDGYINCIFFHIDTREIDLGKWRTIYFEEVKKEYAMDKLKYFKLMW